MVGGKPISTRTVIWTAGVTNHPFFKENAAHFTLAKNGRVEVDEYMLAAPDVYVIGDNANTPHTGLAQTALHDAIFVAKNIRRELQSKKLKKYKPVKPPVVIPVGENWAVLEWKKIVIGGLLGSLIRRAADFIGYSDYLPLGQALGVWHASTVMEDTYFTPLEDNDGRTARK
jgi:NADH dehydrogenase